MRRIALCGDSRHHQAIFAGEADTINDYGKEIVRKESGAACSQINESHVRLLSLSPWCNKRPEIGSSSNILKELVECRHSVYRRMWQGVLQANASKQRNRISNGLCW
jgi:hypothetical protein